MTKVLCITIHHRPIGHFYATQSALYENGYKNWLIVNTGRPEDSSKLHGSILNLPNSSFDAGLEAARIYTDRYETTDWDYVLLIDNDCFTRNSSYIDWLVKEATDHKADFVSHMENSDGPSRTDPSINGIKEQAVQVHTTEEYPYVRPIPHWENSLTLIKFSLWKSIESKRFSHTRMLFVKMAESNAKMFHNHQVTYPGNLTHHTPGWFHIGGLMRIYYAVEQGNYLAVSDSDNDLARLGFLVRDKQLYPDTYTQTMHQAITNMCNQHGGEALCLDRWYKYTKNTIMENWN